MQAIGRLCIILPEVEGNHPPPNADPYSCCKHAQLMQEQVLIVGAPMNIVAPRQLSIYPAEVPLVMQDMVVVTLKSLQNLLTWVCKSGDRAEECVRI